MNGHVVVNVNGCFIAIRKPDCVHDSVHVVIRSAPIEGNSRTTTARRRGREASTPFDRCVHADNIRVPLGVGRCRFEPPQAWRAESVRVRAGEMALDSAHRIHTLRRPPTEFRPAERSLTSHHSCGRRPVWSGATAESIGTWRRRFILLDAAGHICVPTQAGGGVKTGQVEGVCPRRTLCGVVRRGHDRSLRSNVRGARRGIRWHRADPVSCRRSVLPRGKCEGEYL